jgi:hypothetical protein
MVEYYNKFQKEEYNRYLQRQEMKFMLMREG